MALHNSKSKLYAKPMITEMSIAKQKINQLFEREPLFKILELEKLEKEDKEDKENEQILIVFKHAFKFYINSNKLVSKFKIIIKESNVEYKDVLNYTLAILNNKILKILFRFDERFKDYSEKEYNKELSKEDALRKSKLERNFTKYIIGFIDFVFFLYSVSPRVNSSIKLAKILSSIIKYYKGYYKIKTQKERFPRIKESNKDLVFKKISDEISLILERHEMDTHTQIEVLYLLIVLQDLGKKYRLNENQLVKYFNCGNKEGHLGEGEIVIKEKNV